MCNVYRPFASRLEKTAARLKKETGKGELFELKVLTNTDFDAFREPSKKLVSTLIQEFPPHCYRGTIETDACEYQVGCALLQKQSIGDDAGWILAEDFSRCEEKLFHDRQRLPGAVVGNACAAPLPMQLDYHTPYGPRLIVSTMTAELSRCIRLAGSMELSPRRVYVLCTVLTACRATAV